MAVTTYAAIRDAQIAAIIAITPTLHADVLFTYVPDESTDFRTWVEKNPQAAFRKFSIEYITEDEPEVSGLDAEPRMVTAQIVVAYPKDKRYGAQNIRKLADLMESDTVKLVNAAGRRGFANIGPDATIVTSQPERDTTGPVAYLTIVYTAAFWQSVA